MAIKGRNDLEQLTGGNLPTNNSKQITAEKHREVVNALIESKFNLLDDELAELKYDAQNTLAEYLSNFLRNVIKRGSFMNYDVRGNPVGSTLDIEDATNSPIQSATVVAVGDDGDRIRIEFKEPIDTKIIIPVMHGSDRSNYHHDYDIGTPVIYRGNPLSSTQIELSIREFSTNRPQNLKIEFIII
jgi:hypothetical protein